jgi:hypothetical protein
MIGIPRLPCGIYYKAGRKSVDTSIGVCAVLVNSAVALCSSEFKLKSGINRFPYGLPPFIPF